ncbi:MAG: HAD family hydrolase, partial [Gammaproteobacteria bacterium]|nr:HAD family hydrolase [Gammaproteobacteria bacterium]
GIVAEVLGNLFEPSDAPEIAARIKRRFIELVGDYLRKRPAAAEPIAGAAELLERLAATEGVAVAIATGGWRETAEIKLAHAGINTDGIALATSSEAHARIDIMKLAEKMTRIAHFDCRTYFGDGPWDLEASTELGYAFIGVGANVEHTVVVEDFSDADRVLSLLGKN